MITTTDVHPQEELRAALTLPDAVAAPAIDAAEARIREVYPHTADNIIRAVYAEHDQGRDIDEARAQYHAAAAGLRGAVRALEQAHAALVRAYDVEYVDTDSSRPIVPAILTQVEIAAAAITHHAPPEPTA